MKNKKTGSRIKSGMTKGFTLIELLLYIAISAILLMAVSAFLTMLLQARIKNQTVAEVEQQGMQIMQVITQATRNAAVINSPAIGTSSSSLSLNTYITTTTPTVFDLSSGALRISEAGGAVVALSNARVIASNLVFWNFSRAATPGTVHVEFTLTHINPMGRNEYNFSKTFVDSAALHQP